MKTFERLTAGHTLPAPKDRPAPAHWLLEFQRSVNGVVRPSLAASHLVQMCVKPEGACTCDEFDLRHAEFAWLHANHTAYNRAVREVIDSIPGLREKLRRALRDDLKVVRADPEMEGYGRIVKQTYGRDLNNHFLSVQPDPAWVGNDE